jgi:hypothetical protein
MWGGVTMLSSRKIWIQMSFLIHALEARCFEMVSFKVITYVGAMIATVSYLAVVAVLLKSLRTYQPAVWDALGRPTLFLNNSIANSFRVAKFVLGREYRNVDRGPIQKLGRAAFLLFVIAVFLSLLLTIDIAIEPT